MDYILMFHPEAVEEYQEAFVWYEQQESGLGLHFEKMVEDRLQKIVEHPEHYGMVKKPFREVSIDVFPFVIVYKFNKKHKSIYISSVFHTSRNTRSKYRK